MVTSRSRRGALLAVVALLGAALAVVAPASAGASGRPADTGDQRIAGVATVAPKVGGKTSGSGAAPMEPCRPDDCNPCYPDCSDPVESYCAAEVFYNVGQGDNPELGGPYAHVNFDGHWYCVGYTVATVTAQTKLVDRTPGYDGRILGSGPQVTGTNDVWNSGSGGAFEVDYPAGQQAEVIIETTLVTQHGIWASCLPMPSGLRYIRCDGVLTNTIHVTVGTGTFATGVVAADCNHRSDHTLQWVASGTIRARMIVHVGWCTFSNGKVKSVNRVSATELASLPDQGVYIRFENTDPPDGWVSSTDGRGHYQVSVLIGLNGKNFPWCHMTVHGVYLGTVADYSEDNSTC